MGATIWIGLGYIALWVAAIIGWILNIVQVVQMADESITGMFVLKCVGILAAPLGAVLGWIG